MFSPNNPTGLVFNATALKEIVDVANEHNLYIICDEIYDQIVFDEKFTGIGKVANDSPIIILNGFSKVHLMSGWRIGYIAFNNSPQLDNIRENLPKDGIWRLISSDEIAKTVWNAYNSDKIHWYVPKELEDLEKEVAKNPLNAREILKTSGPLSND